VDYLAHALSNPALRQAIAFLLSEPMQRVYFIIVLAVVLAFSLRKAQQQDKFLKGFDCQLAAADDFEVRKPGPKPAKIEGLKRRIEVVEAAFATFKAALATKLVANGRSLFVYGLLIPTVAFGLFLYEYPWLNPRSAALAFVGSSPIEARHASVLQVTAVVAAQLALGLESASRLIESILALTSANWSVPSINDHDLFVEASVFGFRLVVGAVLSTLLYFVTQAIALLNFEPKQLRLLRRQLRDAIREERKAARAAAVTSPG